VRIDVLTTFPAMFASDAPGALGFSIPARARAAGLVEWHAHDIRAYTHDKHQKTDDRPFGGGPGMVMMAQPVWDAVTAVEAMDDRPAARVLLSPQGIPLTQPLVEDIAAHPRLLLIAGHYEGLDERVVQKLAPLEVSLGDFVLSGGELGALVLIDAVTRLLPGALGDEASSAQDSFSPAPTTDAIGVPLPARRLAALGLPKDATPPRLLDCPHYTKPRVWEGMEVPGVLLSGDHQAIAAWRLEQRLARTRARRPDLLGESPRDAHGDARSS
jgi:tRNA (guanine37-N1)-methyltransferase